MPDQLSPTQRRLLASAAAYSRWAKEDPKKGTEPARAAAEARWLDEVDPKRQLPEDERLRRAERAKRAYFQKLALRSVTARRAARKGAA
jgi:hypothetical protein